MLGLDTIPSQGQGRSFAEAIFSLSWLRMLLGQGAEWIAHSHLLRGSSWSDNVKLCGLNAQPCASARACTCRGVARAWACKARRLRSRLQLSIAGPAGQAAEGCPRNRQLLRRKGRRLLHRHCCGEAAVVNQAADLLRGPTVERGEAREADGGCACLSTRGHRFAQFWGPALCMPNAFVLNNASTVPFLSQADPSCALTACARPLSPVLAHSAAQNVLLG